MKYTVDVMKERFNAGNLEGALTACSKLALTHIEKEQRDVVRKAVEVYRDNHDKEDELVVQSIAIIRKLMGLDSESETELEEESVEEESVEEESVEEPQVGGITRVEKDTEDTEDTEKWILITVGKKGWEKGQLFVTVFKGDSREKLTELQNKGQAFVTLASLSKWKNLYETAFAVRGGKGVASNLKKKGIEDLCYFVYCLLDISNREYTEETLPISVFGEVLGQKEIVKEEDEEGDME